MYTQIDGHGKGKKGKNPRGDPEYCAFSFARETGLRWYAVDLVSATSSFAT